MTTVEIEYCVPCGHLDRAQKLQRALLQSLGQDLDAVTLRTGDSGVFTVSVDSETIFDVADDAFDPDEIVRDVRGRL